MRGKGSFFLSTCHNSFARLPLNWSLGEMLMLRESGSLRLATSPPPLFPPSWAPRWLATTADERTHEELWRGRAHVGQIGADSQSDWFK